MPFWSRRPEHWSPLQDWYFRPDQRDMASWPTGIAQVRPAVLAARPADRRVSAFGQTFESRPGQRHVICALVQRRALATVQDSWAFHPDWRTADDSRRARRAARADQRDRAAPADRDDGQGTRCIEVRPIRGHVRLAGNRRGLLRAVIERKPRPSRRGGRRLSGYAVCRPVPDPESDGALMNLSSTNQPLTRLALGGSLFARDSGRRASHADARRRWKPPCGAGSTTSIPPATTAAASRSESPGASPRAARTVFCGLESRRRADGRGADAGAVNHAWSECSLTASTCTTSTGRARAKTRAR